MCKAVFTCNAALNKHKSVHPQGRTKIKSFERNESHEQKKHVSLVHEGKNIEPKRIAALEKKGKTYPCDICGHRFLRPQNLKKYVEAKHKKVKRFTCSTCEKKFYFFSTVEKTCICYT